ncbi:hypothetical protein QQ008_22175 [Fulvivirgaceae bacterium BMA10]|uniref:Uncharacterized protein n=1 Tax=Splendidivirga corallicola TaxID=3051826 RepID=A0ABT8KTP8_9BACT|nr:hypothetical protein [Fulvivirgaceae bacterium BMA10]
MISNLKKIFTARVLAFSTFMIVVGVGRIILTGPGHIPTLSNFSPIGAMALFGGAYFSRERAFIFPLLTLWLSDIVLNKLVFYGEWRLFYEGFYWVYGAFALMVLVGKLILQHKTTIKNFAVATITIVMIHWIITDIQPWLSGTLYPKTLAGYGACLIAALPYERNFLIGTLIYGAIMFGVFEWMQFKIPALRRSTQEQNTNT